MDYREILRRLTGFSTPVFGVSWNPPVPEIMVANRVINFLEDRRVLYNVYLLEMPDHCVQSVIEIRHFLTQVLGELTTQQELIQHLKAMRAACIDFLNVVQEDQSHLIIRNSFDTGPRGWTFFSALGDLRTSIGFRLAALAVMYGIDIKGDLASILPPHIEEDDMSKSSGELK